MKHIVLPTIHYIDLRIRKYVYALGDSRTGYPWMNIMLSGKLEYRLDYEPVVLTEGNVLLFKPGDIAGRREQYTDVRYLSINFDMNGNTFAIDNQVPVIGERQRQLIYMLQNYYFGNELGIEENRTAAEQILYLLLQEFEHNCRQINDQKRITQIQNYILQHYHEGIRSSDVANAFSLHPSYLNTLYKNSTGENLSTFLTRTRLEHAKARLIYSVTPIREIAAECGFTDVCYFSRWFSKKEGCSPNEFRKKTHE